MRSNYVEIIGDIVDVSINKKYSFVYYSIKIRAVPQYKKLTRASQFFYIVVKIKNENKDDGLITGNRIYIEGFIDHRTGSPIKIISTHYEII